MKQLFFLIAILLTILSCNNTCETEEFSFPVTVVDNIIEDRLPFGEELLIEIEIPHIITDDDGNQFNIEREQFEIGVTFQKYANYNCDGSPFLSYEEAIGDIEVTLSEGEELEDFNAVLFFGGNTENTSSVYLPQMNESNRTLKLSILPTVQDTFVVHFTSTRWDSNREEEACFDLNRIAFENPIKGLESEVKNQFVLSSQKVLDVAPDNIIFEVYEKNSGGILLIVE